MKRTLTTAELASATYATYDQAGVHLNAAAFLATPAGQELLAQLKKVVRFTPALAVKRREKSSRS